MNDYTPDREINPPEEALPEIDDPMLDCKIDDLLDIRQNLPFNSSIEIINFICKKTEEETK